MSTELGMRPLMERVLSRKKTLEVWPGPLSDLPKVPFRKLGQSGLGLA